MDDNARSHQANHLRETITRMDRPSRSPDINHTEHVWDMHQTVIFVLPVQRTIVADFKVVLIDECAQIVQIEIKRTITDTMRIAAHAQQKRY